MNCIGKNTLTPFIIELVRIAESQSNELREKTAEDGKWKKNKASRYLE